MEKASKFDQYELYEKIKAEFIDNEKFAELRKEMNHEEQHMSHEMEERKT